MNRSLPILIYSLSIVVGIILAFLLINKQNIKEPIETKTEPLESVTTYDPNQIVNYIAVIGDTHLSFKNYNKLGERLKKYKPSLLVHLGDHTDYGELEKLKIAKNLLDGLSTPYAALPGDRDLAASSGSEYFYKVFPKIRDMDFQDYRLLFIDNSANFSPLNKEEFNSYLEEIPKADIIFTSQPILTEKGSMFSEKYMGSTEDEDFIKNHVKEVKEYQFQRDEILSKIRQSKIKYVISSDHHFSNTFNDASKNNITFHQIGSLSDTIQLGDLVVSQNALQSNRFTLIKFSNNGEIKIEEIILD